MKGFFEYVKAHPLKTVGYALLFAFLISVARCTLFPGEATVTMTATDEVIQTP